MPRSGGLQRSGRAVVWSPAAHRRHVGAGQPNTVRQFRLPGYPFVLVTTDLLQEGEDLHTFCDCVYHYGISWTPSAMEQRTGRIDRVRSLTERRLVDWIASQAETRSYRSIYRTCARRSNCFR